MPTGTPTPTIGRIVHYHCDWMNNGKLRTFPALVVVVHDSGEVTLAVFAAPEEPGAYFVSTTSRLARFSPEPADGCWSWPPRGGSA